MPVLAYQGLQLSPGVFGTIMSVAAVGAILGAVLAPAVSRPTTNVRPTTPTAAITEAATASTRRRDAGAP